MKFKNIFILLLASVFISCTKDFLAVKPDKQLAVPATLADFQALLDNADIMNYWMPYLGEISSDDYYLEDAVWASFNWPPEKNSYIWAKEILEGNYSADWENMCLIVFYANNVLEGLEKMKEIDDRKRYNEIKGSALFFRGYAFYQLSQLFCAPFNAKDNNEGLGIPLRLNSDINLQSKRSKVSQTYQQILNDLTSSVLLLPHNVSIKTRPNKTSAFALLSRVYLLMQDYDKSLKYADSALMGPGFHLLDFNHLDIEKDFPIEEYNSEVIFQTSLNFASNLATNNMIVDSQLHSLYGDNDLRKKAWFKNDAGRIRFKGNYNGSSFYFFSGLALNEVFLNKTECLARIGNVSESISILNSLLEKRFEAGKFIPIIEMETDKLLDTILKERRKELLFRGIRWSDLRRLNLDPATEKVLYRDVKGDLYRLDPNSPNYVFPIPDNVIKLSGIEQNQRQ